MNHVIDGTDPILTISLRFSGPQSGAHWHSSAKIRGVKLHMLCRIISKIIARTSLMIETGGSQRPPYLCRDSQLKAAEEFWWQAYLVRLLEPLQQLDRKQSKHSQPRKGLRSSKLIIRDFHIPYSHRRNYLRRTQYFCPSEQASEKINT